jgi:phage gpG-like protein
MLDALVGRGKSGQIEIEIKDTRRPGGKTNREVAGYASEERPFLAFTKKEASFIDQKVRKAFLELIRRAIR